MTVVKKIHSFMNGVFITNVTVRFCLVSLNITLTPDTHMTNTVTCTAYLLG